MESRPLRHCGLVSDECVRSHETFLTQTSPVCDFLQSLSISSSEMDRSESGNAPRIQTPSEHETSPMLCRDPKQDALLNELNRRILKSRSFSDVSQS